jgi:bifunctional non-homologous end joining protein LigD
MSPDAVREQSLSRYRAKRDFTRTPEPKGKALARKGSERRFVVQRHRARRLHYDFRLEVDGVLASWAMPKGPSMDPGVRSLAVHVEDHPLEYRDFEGVIPGGQYGAGDVIVWDRGTWEPAGDEEPVAAIAEGELHFDLHGEKLAGRFVLVRTKSDQRGQEQWLMLHKRDEFAEKGWKPDDHPRSVKSGKTNEEVRSSPDSMWHGERPAPEAEERLGRNRHTAATGGASPAELDALSALGDAGTWEVGGHRVKLTNLDKVLFPGHDRRAPVTKRDLVRYYAVVAPVMLPYLEHRAVNMLRHPNGVDRPGFWHKAVPSYAPEWLTRWSHVESGGESKNYAVVDSVASLVWMANYAAVELHPWTSLVDAPEEPTWAYIDIDPGTKTKFEDVLLLARLFRTGLEHLGVVGMPKLTGKRGVHIWIPIAKGYTFDYTRAWVEQLSKAVGSTVPDTVSWTWEKSSRHGLARLDYTQNAINKTLVAPYSVRAAVGAPVSVPVEWEELEGAGLRSDTFTIDAVIRRVHEVGDPFVPLRTLRQELPDI